MFKQQHYEIIFIILLMLALQFQLSHPAYWRVSVVCFCGEFWRVHSPKHLQSPSSEPPKPLFDSLSSEIKNWWFEKEKSGFFEDVWWKREGRFSGYKKSIMQIKYKTTQYWRELSREKRSVGCLREEERVDCFSQSCLLSISSLFSPIRHNVHPLVCFELAKN